ncbi:MAG: hypothetical protein M1822_002631 [Bathelium mastoideum]|nr:MAG: hypothetical protein M1822_002631 [Bathelium mastoideum]
MRASLREVPASTQEHQNEDKPGRFWSLFKNWGSTCGKASPGIQHSIDAKPKTDGYSVNMKLSMTAKLHYNAAGQMIAREVDSSESHSVKRKPVHASGKRYGADKVLNLPRFPLGQAGGAEWDWESPTTIPKYASTYNPGNLKRRNALHRASASARASVANLRKKGSVGGPGFERHDSASVLNDDVSDAVLRSRNSWDENSEYFTASAHSSLELNRASGSSLRELLPNASSGAEASATNAGDTLIAPLNSPKRPQRTYSWESSEESLSTSFDLPMMGTDRNIRFRQEALDYGLHLELRWEEEEEDQRRQEQSSTKTCIICTDDLHVLDFQVKPPTARCNHPVETCQNCVQQWIASEFESNGWEHIKCPQCLELLDHADMQAAADPDLFARTDTNPLAKQVRHPHHPRPPLSRAPLLLVHRAGLPLRPDPPARGRTGIHVYRVRIPALRHAHDPVAQWRDVRAVRLPRQRATAAGRGAQAARARRGGEQEIDEDDDEALSGAEGQEVWLGD